jgi:hypothetical protein
LRGKEVYGWWRTVKRFMWIFRYKNIPAWISAKLRKEDTQEYAWYLTAYVESDTDEFREL